MDLRHLQYMVAVAEEANFTKAALRLHLAQPPLSRQIAQLEEELGVTLFNRGRRTSILTPAGQVFYERAKAILSDVALLVRQTQRAARGEFGTLTIAYIAALSDAFLPSALKTYRTGHPDVEITLTDMSEVAQRQALLNRTIDVGFQAVPPAQPIAGLRSQCFRRERLRLLLQKDHRLAHRSWLKLKDLSSERCIAISHRVSPDGYALLRSLYSQAGFIIQQMSEVDNGQAVIDFVAAGFGIAVVPSSFAGKIGSSVVLRDIRPALVADLHVFWREDETSSLVLSFVEQTTTALRPRR
jgi:DNA-binding transcriptional LysR family regulator